MRRHALEFATEQDFRVALMLLQELAATGPLEYDPIGDGREEPLAAVLPEWSYNRLVPLLRERNVRYEELEVLPVSALPPKEQAELRGLKQGRGYLS